MTLTGPQGSNDAIVPRADNFYAHVAGLWDEIGMPRSYDFVEPTGSCVRLKFARDQLRSDVLERGCRSLGYYFDEPFASKRAWVVDPWTDDLAPCADFGGGPAQLGGLEEARACPHSRRRGSHGPLARLDVLWRSGRSRTRPVERRLPAVRSARGDRRLWREFRRGFGVWREIARPAGNRRLRP